jgi:hypothetical protein
VFKIQSSAFAAKSLVPPAFRATRDLVTVAVSASSASPSTTTAAATAATTILTGTRLVYGKRPSLKVLTVEGLHCRLCSVSHFHKTETARFAGLAIHYDLCRSNSPMRAEQLAEIIGRRLERQISHVQILTHCHPL